MPNDPNGDIQIKTTTPAASSGAVGATPTTGDGNAASGAGTTGKTATPATPNEPVNKRAFNLEADVENSATGMAKPEKFAIPKLVKEKYPDLIDLIKSTESMDDQERQYWFQILPVMTDEQIVKFKNILITEKQQLSELDKEYEDELNKLNEKHLLEWKEFESKEKSRAIQEAEAKSNEEEKQEEEALLAKLSDV